MELKRILVTGLFFICLAIAIYFASFGKHGLVAYYQLRAGCKKREQRIAQMHKEIALLKHETLSWQDNPLKKESFMRYDLAMGYTNELVYLVKK